MLKPTFEGVKEERFTRKLYQFILLLKEFLKNDSIGGTKLYKPGRLC